MSSRYRAPISSRVKLAYSCQSSREVSAIRGRRPSALVPGTSLPNITLPPAPMLGKTATNSTTMPMPPSHWMSERHSMSGRDSRPSMSVITVAPVVVRPLTDSKSASCRLMPAPKTNGIAPKKPAKTQMRATASTASRRIKVSLACRRPYQ